MTFHFWYAFAKYIANLQDPVQRERKMLQFRPAYVQLIDHLKGTLTAVY